MSPAARILLLEADPAIAATVAFALRRAERACAILDVGRPGGSGLDLCREDASP